MSQNAAAQQSFKPTDKYLIGLVLSVITFWLFAQSLISLAGPVADTLKIPEKSINSVSMAISLTALVSGCFTVVAGGLADRFGRLKFTQLGIILSIISSILIIVSENMFMFCTARVLQGFSAACIMPATLALVKAFYTDSAARQRALSFWSIGSFGGSALFTFVGGGLTGLFGWKSIFIVSILCALLSFVLIMGSPESKAEQTGEKKRFDSIGLIVFLLSMCALNVGITQGRNYGWTSPFILSTLASFVVLLVIFIKIELAKKDAAFINFALFKHKAYTAATVSNFFLNFGVGMLLVLNNYLQKGLNLDTTTTALLSVGYIIAILGAVRVGEKLLQILGAKKPMLLGGVILTVSILLLSYTSIEIISYPTLVVFCYIGFGLGVGLFATPATDTAVSNSPPDQAGSATGIFKMGSALGGSLGIAIAGSIYFGIYASTKDYAIAAQYGFIIIGIASAISLFATIFLLPKLSGNSKK